MQHIPFLNRYIYVHIPNQEGGFCVKENHVYMLIAVLIVILCSACGSTAKQDDNSNADKSSNIEEDKKIEESDNEESEEDEVNYVLATAEPIVLAHSDEYSAENYKPGRFSDNQNYATLKRATYSDKGFYAFNEEDNCLNYIDAKTGKQTVLCHDVACEHSDRNCNAWYLGVKGIYYNDGYVYVMAENMTGEFDCLYRMNSDGSNKVTIAKLFEHEKRDLPCSPQFIIHRGYGYLTVNWMDTGASIEREEVLYKVSLEDGSKDEIFRFKGYCPQIYIENTEDNNIYFGTSEYRNGIPNEYQNKEYCYNAADNSINERYASDDKIVTASYDNKVYLLDRENETLENGMSVVKKFAIYSADKDGKNSKCIYKMPDKEINKKIEVQEINNDGRYIYMHRVVNGRYHNLKVIDINGKEILDLDNDKYGYCRWSDGKRLLLIDTKTSKYSVYDIKSGSIVSEE